MEARTAGLGGVVLCGGRSSRMGRPKAWLPFGGQALLQRTVFTLRSVCDPVVVIAAPEQSLPELPGDVVILRDPVEGRGPLQGIAVGLAYLAGRREAAYVSSTDVPFLHPALIRRLACLRIGEGSGAEERAHEARYDIAVPRADGHYHPLSAVYSCSLFEQARALLDAGRLRPFFLFESVRTLVADDALLLAGDELRAADPTLRSLRNINTPEEYEAALLEAGERG